MAYFEIRNIGDASETFASTIYAVGSDGEKYDPTIALGFNDKYSDTFASYKTLPPNTKTSGWVAVKVPDGTSSTNLYFEYTNSFLTKNPKYIRYKINK